MMGNPKGESDRRSVPPVFDRRPMLEFQGSRVTSDAGLLGYRELDETLARSGRAMGGDNAQGETGEDRRSARQPVEAGWNPSLPAESPTKRALAGASGR